MNIASPLQAMVPAFPLTNRVGSPAAPAAEPQQEARVTNKVKAPTESEDSGKAAEKSPGREKQAASEKDANAQGLDSAQLKQLAELKSRDREVRAHEAAHQAVGGQYAGAISYVYERGPDGAQYAVGGEVSIDTAPVDGNPQATIEKMRTVRAAALAPAEPSPQDRSVAAQAMQLMLQAQSELAADLGNEDNPQSASADENRTARVSQDANDAYQSIFRLDEANSARPPSEAFQATA